MEAATVNKAPRRAAPAKPALTLKVEGPGIGHGRIRVPDLLVICQQAQQAVNRQAEAMEGRQTLRPGPKIGKVRQECTLELVALGKGSATLSFDPTKPQQTLPPMSSFGVEAIVAVTDAVALMGKGKDGDVDPGVLGSLKEMGELFHSGVRSIKWIVPAAPGRRRRVATFNTKVQRRIVQKLRPPITRPVSVQGTLEMADFKPSEFKCRIHPPLQLPITCTFGPEHAHEICAALRLPVEVTGTAQISAQTGKMESIAVDAVKPLDPLLVNAGSFFKGWSLDQLAYMQGVEPVRDPKKLVATWMGDEDVDEMLNDIYQHRE